MAKVYSNKIKLPNNKKMKEVVERDNIYWDKYFNKIKNNYHCYVDLNIYSNDISRKVNVDPDYFKLFINSPKKCWKALSAPYNNSRYLLNNTNNHDYIFKNCKNNNNFIFYSLALIIKPFYKFIRNYLVNRNNNSIINDKNDKNYQEKRRKKFYTFIILLIMILLIYIVPEWNKYYKNRLIYFLGDLENYKNRKFNIIFLLIIIFLLYSD